MHGELLRLAGVLAAEASGRPRWVARSRAVSTAYYALFHALAELCARELVGVRRAAEPYRHVYRSLDHSHARRVLDAVRREASSGDDLRVIADVFVEAQQDRHRATTIPATVSRLARLRSSLMGYVRPSYCSLGSRPPSASSSPRA